MSTRTVAIAAALFGIAAMIAGCHSAESDWTKASGTNTVAAYQQFVAEHPKDQHASEAKAMVLELQDDESWQEAQHTGTTAGYQAYLEGYPQGSHAVAAKDAMTATDRAAAWKSAKGTGTATAIEAFLQKYPSGAESDQARAMLKNLTAYKVHLASEPSDAKAQRKLEQIKSRLKDAASAFTVAPDSDGKSFSIDSQGMTEEAANSACESIKRKHETCQVVKQ